jgi:hypothetical protein
VDHVPRTATAVQLRDTGMKSPFTSGQSTWPWIMLLALFAGAAGLTAYDVAVAGG